MISNFFKFDPNQPENGPADQVLARTAWGENRGGGQVGLQSVINVIMNRAAHPGWWGTTPIGVNSIAGPSATPIGPSCLLLPQPTRCLRLLWRLRARR
jgi:hypothetical protein